MLGPYDDEIKFPRFWMVAVFWENRYFEGVSEAMEWISRSGGFVTGNKYFIYFKLNKEENLNKTPDFLHQVGRCFLRNVL